MVRSFHKLSFSVLSLLCLTWAAVIFPFSKQDVIRFEQFLQSKQTGKPSSVLSTTKQERKGVVKDLWIAETNARMHHRILGASSTLLLIPKGSHFDLIEKLEGITCWMQEKLYQTPSSGLMQQLRILKAKEGFYTYSNQEFLAQSVDLSLYRLPGSELPQGKLTTSPFLKGVAKEISFTLEGKVPQFKAHQFQAELSQGKNP